MIAIDIDSTLYDFRTPFRQAYLDLALSRGEKAEYFRGAYQPWVEWRSLADICGEETFAEALAITHSPDVILRQNPFDHAVEVVNELAKEHDILFISNRDESTYDATYEWLDMWHFPISDNALKCTMDNKMQWISTATTIIDDRPKTLCDYVYGLYLPDATRVEERTAFGILFEYNRALTDIPGVYLAPTWAGLRFYLQKKGFLND